MSLLAIAIVSASTALAAPPDLTQPGAIAGIDRTYTYNLGATGLRGWIWVDRNNKGDVGLITDPSRQILVTHCVAPANSVLAVDDVILGAIAASSGTVPDFTSDCRKAFGTAIGDAEKTGAGTLRVKRWRAGVITEQNITLPILGNYSATAPFSCPKSDVILNNVRNKMVADLLANPNYLANGFGGASNAIALLSGVKPGDPNYDTVQTRLQTYARARAAQGAQYGGLPIWDWSYTLVFLAEYYLLTGDSQVVPGIQNFTLTLAQTQSIYGTYGHGPSAFRTDGSGRRVSTGYGPVNAVGGTAMIALALGKKALVAASQTIDPEIDAAINRSAGFFAFYVNKGSVPYGEHEPVANNHGSNGKDAMPAVFFSLLPNRAVETEYFSRISLAGWIGREYGHTGQGLSYYWTALGALMGGPDAASEHLKQVRWHLDLSRRTDGSFAYDGQEQYGPGTTSGNTYLGAADYGGMSANAMYLLTYSIPLQRLHITGKNANPAYTLDSVKIADSVAAGSFQIQRASKSVPELFSALGAYHPVVRNHAAIELASRSLSGTDLTSLRNLLTSSDPNLRGSACQTLGIRQDSIALPTIVARLNDPDVWVRAKAAVAIRAYPSATASTHRDAMMTSFINNATDPDVIDWNDPIQMGNGKLSMAVFGHGVGDGTPGNDIAAYTINAPKQTLLYPAVRAGLSQPDSYVRTGATQFCKNRMPLADVQGVYPSVAHAARYDTPADRMWSNDCRADAITMLANLKISDGIELALSMLDIPEDFGWGSGTSKIAALNGLASYGDAARYTLPTLKAYLNQWSPTSGEYPVLVSTINTLENAITAPAQTLGLCVANSQVVNTTGALAITLSGASPRGSFTYLNVSQPAHGTLTGTAPNLTYTPNSGYTGPDSFTFQTDDVLTTSRPGTVSILVGTAGTGLKGEYFDNINFTSPKLTRTDAQVNFDWGTGSPHPAIGANTFSVRWSGVLLVPETGSYVFSTLNGDGVRLYINGVLVIDEFSDQSTNWNDSAPIALTKGDLVDVQMDYYENSGSAVAKLKWRGPSFAGDNGAIIGSQWLYDGTGMNRVPHAFAQSLVVLKNRPKPVTLAGSAGSQTFTIVTPPAHGALSGTAPNLIYTPNANYTGLDSFTFKVNNGGSDSAPATVSLDVLPANTFGVNFYAYGGLTTPEARANLLVSPGMSAGLADWFTYGWTNIEVPWGLSSPQPPATLTSNRGSIAAFVFKSCRNGGPYNWSTPRTTLLGDGNGNMMDGHVNSTLDGPYLFDMEVTGIPFAVYDVIFYIGANQAQFGDGTGVIKFNGGANRAFKLRSGAFNGTFTEMVDATTQGNYIVFPGVSGSSFTTQTWGTGSNGFNHIGPCGFQIREVIVPDASPPTLNGTSFVDDKNGGSVVESTPVDYTVTFGEDMDASTVTADDFGNAGSSSISISSVFETSPGVFIVAAAPTSAGTLRLQVKSGATLNDASGNALDTTSAIMDDTTLTVTANSAPVWTANPINGSNANESQPYSGSLATLATDANGHFLSFAKVSGPAWLGVSASGTLSGTPTSGDVGANSFTVSVSDGIAPAVQATLNITVNPPIPTFTVSYNGNGNTGGSVPTDANNPYLSGSTVTVLGNTGNLARTGYTFAGWNTAANGGGTSYASGATFTINGHTTLYARWNTPPSVNAGPDQTLTIASAPWQPSTLAPQAWYDASDAASITSSGGLVSQWRDKSGNSRHATQTTGANQPATGTSNMGGLNVITLNGTSQFFNANLDYLAGTSHSAFIVTKTSAYRNIYGAANPGLGANSLHVGFSSTTQYRMNFWANDFNPGITSAFVPTGGNVLNYVWTPGVSKQIFANGTSQGTSTNAGNIATMAGGGRIGNVVGQGMYGGDIAEIVFITGTVSPADRERMEGYLAHKWNLQAQLPLSHPYKNAAPITTGVVVTLDGTVSDADPGDTVTSTWTLQSGPGAATTHFGNATAVDTTVSLYQTGVYTLRLAAGDGVSNAFDETIITVNPPNTAPAWTANPVNEVNATEDAAYSSTLADNATDADNHPLTFAKLSGPAWLSVAPNGDLTGIPANSDVGANSFTVSVSDGIAPTVEATLNITVTNTNDAPTWTVNPITGSDATEDSAYSGSIAGTASDVDAGAALTYAKVSGPAWLGVASDGTLSGTPANNDVGANSFTVSVSDGIAPAVNATLDIIVINTNDAPEWAGNPIAAANATEDMAYTGSLAASASDVDAGASLTFVKVSGPAWLSVAANGTLSGTPGNSNVGANSFTISVSDGIAPAVEATINISVINTNDAPTWAGNPINGSDATEDSVYSGSLAGSASDVDPGASLTFAKISGPAWLNVASNGALSGTPDNSNVGANSFTVSVSDGIATAVQATLNITITNTNDAPVFTADPITLADATENIAYTGQTLAGRATDPDSGDTLSYSKVSGPAWLNIASNGTITGTPPSGSAGLNTFIVRATDSTSATGDTTLRITVVGLPLPWVAGDIGTGMLAGSTTHSSGTFTQTGSGVIGGTSDRFRFTYQTLTGDGEIIARISSLQNTGNSSRVGVMIRDTLAPNSKEIFMGMTSSGAYRWVRRTTTGGSTTSSNSSTGTVPNTWVRLVRSGTTITAYKSTNGTSWTTVGSTTNTTISSTCYIGLAVGSGSSTTLNTSQFSNLSVTP